MRRLKSICILLILISFGCAAATWQTVSLVDPKQTVSQTGLGAFPGISLFAVIVTVAMFVSRYSSVVTQRIIFGLVSILGVAVNVAPTTKILGAPFDITTLQIANATGVSGWSSQVAEVIENTSGPSAFAYLYLITTLAALAVMNISPRANTPKTNESVPNSEPELWVN